MSKVCLLDGHTLEVIGTTEILKRLLVVRRCSNCGEVTFWDDYGDISEDQKQHLLKAMMDD